ncbi:NADH-quinone oxidoreductase subunit F [bacterium BFN5]|nr:NADH-quinone oxidoreductase subunit F [bacterium BFN5]QJW47524.1 NADH-quinone oxidoreductase subunit F [bacterium BFN5]
MIQVAKKQAVARLLQGLGKKIVSSTQVRAHETEIVIEKTQLPEVCRYLVNEKQGRLFTMVGTDERQTLGSFVLYYVVSFDQIGHFITVKTPIDETDPVFPSISVQVPAANWYEREVKDLLGLRALGHPDRRPLVLHGDWPEDQFPLRKDFQGPVARQPDRETTMQYGGRDVTEIPVGPIHAGIIEPGHFRFGAVGDTVLHLEAKLFYTHRGIEKSSEGLPLSKALFTAERICGVCALSHSVAFAQAVESAAQVTLPPRALYLRTLLLELERLYNHIGDIGNMCAGFGFAVGISHGARLREQLQQLNEQLVGHRFLRGVIALGGLRFDLAPAEIRAVSDVLSQVEADFDQLVEIILSHEIAVDRMATTGVLSLEQARDLAVVGVAARASGCSVDIRRDHPYAAYRQVKFPVALQTAGDVLARFKVRVDEVKSSLLIIQQVIEQLPAGSIAVPLPLIKPYTQAMGWVESPRGEVCHWLMTGPEQTVFRYRIRSAAYSNWPAVPLTVPGNIVPDFPLINKSFELCYSCCDR